MPVSQTPVVIGAGMAGLLAAAALRRVHPSLIVLDRDPLPAEPAPRRGVPQSDQLHNLLTRAQEGLDALLPSFTDRLLAAGGCAARCSTETHVHELGIAMPERDLGMRLMCAPRPLIEHVARTILLEEGGVDLRAQVRVVGLVSRSGDVVEGVLVGNTDGASSAIASNVVIDASGSSSGAMQWLADVGAPTPIVDESTPDQWYVSLRYRRPEGVRADPSFWLAFPVWPGTAGALVSPVDPDHWQVSVSGRSADPMPRTPDDVLAHVQGLDDPRIAEILSAATPVSLPSPYKKIRASWRRFDLLDRPLAGFLPLGDSVASLNPLFGQGISVAAWQAVGLADLGTELGLDGLSTAAGTARFHRAAGAACHAAWTLGRVVDERLAESGGSGHLDGGRGDVLGGLITDDLEVHRRFVAMWHLMETADSLLDDAFLRRLDERVSADTTATGPAAANGAGSPG